MPSSAMVRRARDLSTEADSIPLFDFREMAMRSLGSHWRAIDAHRRRLSRFTKLLEKAMQSQSISMMATRIYTAKARWRLAVVDSRLVGKDKPSTRSYRFIKVDGKWHLCCIAENIAW